MAEAFFKTLNQDYVHENPLPSVEIVFKTIAEWFEDYFEDYNENNPSLTIAHKKTLPDSVSDSVIR